MVLLHHPPLLLFLFLLLALLLSADCDDSHPPPLLLQQQEQEQDEQRLIELQPNRDSRLPQLRIVPRNLQVMGDLQSTSAAATADSGGEVSGSSLSPTSSFSDESVSSSLVSSSSQQQQQQEFIFAVSPKYLTNPFFYPVKDGSFDAAAKLTANGAVNVTILWVGSEKLSAGNQSKVLLDLIRARAIHGLALSVIDMEVGTQVINEAVRSGIPVVTFDSDAPASLRSNYVGTQQYDFGYQLGNLVKQLLPEGGTYAIISSPSEPNIFERHVGVEESLKHQKHHVRVGQKPWVQVPNSPSESLGNPVRALMEAELFARRSHPTVIISVLGAPMRTGQGWMDFVARYPNITFMIGDAMPIQLEMLQHEYVNGLLGQQPYEMGFITVETLYDLVMRQKQPGNSSVPPPAGPEIIPTAFVQHLMVPLQLPPVSVDNNLLGNLRFVGIGLFIIVATTAILFALWAYRHRQVSVVRISQPLFLIMVAFGVFITSCTMIPLSFDVDTGFATDAEEAEAAVAKASEGIMIYPLVSTVESNWRGTAYCMSFQWLFFIGFTTTFSALFAKTYRVNRIFKVKRSFRRYEVTRKHVLVPFPLLLTANFILLLTWTLIDPLTYRHMNHMGTDAWDRVVSTYGTCVPSSHSLEYLYFLVPLAVVNLGILAVANWQAYEARGIEVEFSESKYVALAMGSMFQACVVGLPLLFVVRDQPQAFFLLLVFLLFVILMTILLVIFVPKIILFEELKNQSSSVQMRAINESIRRSSHINMSVGSGKSIRNGLSPGSSKQRKASISWSDHYRRDPPVSSREFEDKYHQWMRSKNSNSFEFQNPPNYSLDFRAQHNGGFERSVVRRGCVVCPSQHRTRDEKRLTSSASIKLQSINEIIGDDDDSCDGEIEFHPTTIDIDPTEIEFRATDKYSAGRAAAEAAESKREIENQFNNGCCDDFCESNDANKNGKSNMDELCVMKNSESNSTVSTEVEEIEFQPTDTEKAGSTAAEAAERKSEMNNLFNDGCCDVFCDSSDANHNATSNLDDICARKNSERSSTVSTEDKEIEFHPTDTEAAGSTAEEK